MKSLTAFSALLLLIPAFSHGQSGRLSTKPSVSSRKVSSFPAPSASPDSFAPDPRFTPDQVVRLQLEALKNNDQPEHDSGIKAAFQFSSPANRASVGPLEHFAEIVRNPIYAPILNHRLSRLDPVTIDGETATQRVTLWDQDGRRSVFLFTLTRQTEGDYRGCWMTDAVLRLANEPKSLV